MMRILITLLVLVGFVDSIFSQSAPKKEAERMWALAIEAKGGREKLHAIENMLCSSDGSYFRGLRKFHIHVVNLYVYPDKDWMWDDQRPSVFGLSMRMEDSNAGTSYSVNLEGPPFKELNISEKKKTNKGMPGIIDLLLETRWDRVIPQSLSEGKLKG